jgi:hypothetical protein
MIFITSTNIMLQLIQSKLPAQDADAATHTTYWATAGCSSVSASDHILQKKLKLKTAALEKAALQHSCNQAALCQPPHTYVATLQDKAILKL